MFPLLAQDEQICVMNYNVLNYPSSNSTDNDNRATAFSDIIEYTMADVIFVQEMESIAGADLLVNALNVNTSGITYARAPQFFSYNNLGNMLFYNTAKLSLESQTELPRNNIDPIGTTTNATPRAHTHYRLYANDPNLSIHNDTTYLDIISMHLKASYTNASGNAIADNQRRLNGCQDLTDYVASMPADRNVIAGGDMNFYDDDFATDTDGNNRIEPGYGEIINNGFIDPQGPWNRESSAFVSMFTQSTRTDNSENVLNQTNGGAIGGLDDRFDLQFFESQMNTGGNDVAYVNGSYTVLGNSGVSLNSAATSGNFPLKTEIHLVSDHYPVLAKYNLFYPPACSPAPIIASIVNDCVGGIGSGMITINASIANGNALQYSLDGINYQNSNVFSNLANGTYSIYINDPASNCSIQEIDAAIIDCRELCIVDDVAVTMVCTGNEMYTVDVEFYAINLSNNQVFIEIDGILTGPFTVTGTGPIYTISVPSTSFLGNATDGQLNVNVVVSDPNAVGNTNGSIVINEVMVNAFGGGGTTDTDNGTGEFIELFCEGPGQCDISCYVVGDDDFAIVIPANTVLNPGDYYVLHGGDDSVDNGFPASNGDFDWNDGMNGANVFPLSGGTVGSLRNSAEQVFLWDNTGNIVDGIHWGGGQNLGTGYNVTLPVTCGGNVVSVLLDDTNAAVNSVSSSGGDATTIQLTSTGTITSGNTPNPGSANNSQILANAAVTCIDSTTYNEPDLAGCSANLSLRLKVFLEGPYDPILGMMHTELNNKGLLPMSQPYNVAPYNYGGTEFTTSLPNSVVDWVLVDVRTGPNNTNLVAQKAGLLHADGSITDVNGISDLTFANVPTNQNFYFIVRHRNHLDVMNASAITGTSLIIYDFTTGSNKAFGSIQKSLVGGAAMIAGDINNDLVIQTTDFDVWKSTPAVLYTYDYADTNMDGIVQTTDYDLWYINRSTNTPSQLAY